MSLTSLAICFGLWLCLVVNFEAELTLVPKMIISAITMFVIYMNGYFDGLAYLNSEDWCILPDTLTWVWQVPYTVGGNVGLIT